MTNTTDHLMRYADAAARWNVSARTVERLVNSGQIARHPHPTDKRVKLIDPEEMTKALGRGPTRTETITVAEAVTVLLMAVTCDEPGVYNLLRSELSGDMLDAVAIMVGGAGKLAELDAKAGYSAEE